MKQNRLFSRTRTTLAIYYAGVMSLILIMLGVGTYQAIKRSYSLEIDRDLQSIGGTLYQSLELQLQQPGRIDPLVEQLLPNLCQLGNRCFFTTTSSRTHRNLSAINQNSYYVRLFNPSGRLLAVAGNYPEGLSQDFERKTWQAVSDREGNNYRQITLLLHTQNEQDWGYLQVGYSLEEYEYLLIRTKKVIILSFIISLVLVGSASWWLAGVAMRPIYESYKQTEQFSGDVAHELRTPLATIQSSVESALLTPHLEPQKALSVLKIVERQNLRLIELVVDLLLLANTRQNLILSHRESCCLNDLIEDLIEELLLIANDNRVTLSHQIQVGESLEILGNCDQIYRLVSNLINNAIQYTPKGGSVIVILKRSDHQALIQVRDTGIGIARSEQQKIFNRFYRVHSDRSRKTGGSGLGLAISQAIAKAHNGSLSVHSELGKGSIFSLKLSLAVDSHQKQKNNRKN